jgi:hypothetical protein
MYERKAMTTGWEIAKGLMRSVLAVALVGSAGVAFASLAPQPATGSDGFVTTWESQMESIFSGPSFVTAAENLRQVAFGGIDIQFNDALMVTAPSLLSIDSDAEFSSSGLSLSTLSRDLKVPNFTVSMFFVDAITFCGGPGSSIIGCGSRPGDLIALNSLAAAGSRGAALLSHELGHNLGLSHLTDSSNLMNSAITGATFLSVAQATTILSSNLVRGGASRIISITPIAVMAAVPEPETWAMMVVGLLGVAGWTRRRQASAG